jgi:hypothetical protein
MPLILGTNSIKDTGYDVANSLRFNDGSSDHLKWTSSPAGNRQKFTFSVWLKRSSLATSMIASSSYSSSDEGYFFFDSSDRLTWQTSASGMGDLKTTRVFRDTSAWMHIVLSVDTTQSTSTSRMRLYINGSEYTWDENTTQPDQNKQIYWNVGGTYFPYIGRRHDGNYFDGYMAEIVHIDDQQLDATSFGEFDEDSPTIWKPKNVSGLTFGGNTSYYLDFEDSSALGNDVSGQNNDWGAVNLTSIDQSTDTCTNNFATLNPLLFHTYSGTYSEGNLKIVASNDSWYADASTIAPSSGKFYMEVKVSAIGNFCALGVGAFPFSNAGHSQLIGELSNTIGWRNNGVLNQNGSAGTSLNSFTTNDIIGMYLDLDNGKFYFSKNGTLESSTGLSLTTGLEYFFVVNPRGSTLELNFGSPPYSVSSSNTDDNGYGNFEYSPNITGDGVAKKFYALNTKNLAEFG